MMVEFSDSQNQKLFHRDIILLLIEEAPVATAEVPCEILHEVGTS